MNDFDFDALQKKRIAQGARHRVRGRKGRLSCDTNYSDRQIAEKAGKVMTYDLKSPMALEMFREMPSDLQREYLERLKEKYALTAEMFAEMLGVSTSAARRIWKETGAGASVRGRKNSLEMMARDAAWKSFLYPVFTLSVPKDAEPEEPQKPEAESWSLDLSKLLEAITGRRAGKITFTLTWRVEE